MSNKFNTIIGSRSARSTRQYWLKVAKGEEPLPELFKITKGNCPRKHWHGDSAVRYISTSGCVICNQENTRKRTAREYVDKSKTALRREVEEELQRQKDTAYLDWFDDIH